MDDSKLQLAEDPMSSSASTLRPLVSEPISPGGSRRVHVAEAGANNGTTQFNEELDGFAFFGCFLYIVFFPLSMVPQLLFFRNVWFLKLSGGAAVPFVMYWAYLAAFVITQPPHLYWSELTLPIVFVVLIAFDTAVSLSNPVYTQKLAAFQQNYQTARRQLGVGDTANTLAQLIIITPLGKDTFLARERLKALGIKVSVKTPHDVLERFDLLNYDVGDQRQRSLERTSTAMRLADKGGFALHGVQLGTSYKRACLEHPDAVDLATVADQLIWGVNQKRVLPGLCVRFFSLEKLPLALASWAYLALVCALPTWFRHQNGSLPALEQWEWVLAGCYIVIVIIFGMQVTFFFMLLADVFKTQYHRLKLLSIMLDPEEATRHALPSLNFLLEQQVLAWVALRRYVLEFSAPTTRFYGQRLSLFAAALLACLVYLIVVWTQHALRSQHVFTSFTILTFLTFVFFFMLVVAYGVLSNGQMGQQRQQIAAKLFETREADLYTRQANSTGAKEVLFFGDELPPSEHEMTRARSLLRDLLEALREAEPVNLLGLSLDSALVGLIGTGLVSMASVVTPILVENFGA